jgi:hypothetical protein
MDSLTRYRVPAVIGAAIVLGALLFGVAEGKKKHKGGTTVQILSSKQSEIVTAGAIQLRVSGTGGRRVVVDGLQGGSATPLTLATKAKGRVVSAPLSSSGKSAIASCSVEGLRARLVKGKGKKSASTSSVVPLTRDLAACQPSPPQSPPGCEAVQPSNRMLPFPNDTLTVADPVTGTGRRLNFQSAEMPRNKGGVPMDPTDFNHADGFSPGSEIIIHIPEVTTKAAFDQTGFVPLTDEHRYADTAQPAVVINADTGVRQPIFAELDALPSKYGGCPADVNLIIRPLENFKEGERYIVALRNVKDASGNTVQAPAPFINYRDNTPTGDPTLEARRPHMEDLFTDLGTAGIQRNELYQAWDFTVASENSLAGRALALRNAAFAQLGDTDLDNGVVEGSAPGFHITSVTDNTTSDPTNPTLKVINGELTNVPCYLHPDCHPGGRLQYQASPNQDTPDTAPNGFADDPATGTTGVEFRCIIPRSTITGGTVHPAKAAMYGHGLLGSYTEVNGASRLGNQGNMVFCATKWAGFSEDDVGTAIGALGDLSNFPQLTDRMLQGFVNFDYLGRALDSTNGFRANTAFQVDANGDTTPDGSAIDTTNHDLYYEGISQGAIMGGALTALSPDFTQSVLDVTGMNYSTLLSRSTDSGEFLETSGPLGGGSLYGSYPNQGERQLVFALMQLLWDRGEADGYAQHMTGNPYNDTPPHNVLLQAAVGDFQVSNLTAEIEARTIGASVYGELDPGRHWDLDPFVGLPQIGTGSDFPFGNDPGEDAALVYYDGGPLSWFNNGAANTPAGMECNHGDPTTNPCQGTALAPTNNTNPVAGTFGADPHSYPRRSTDGLGQIVQWLQPGGAIGYCGSPGPQRPCYANGWTGP